MRTFTDLLFSGRFWVILLISLVGATSITAQKIGDISDAEWQMQPPAEYPDAPAVVIFDVGDMEINTDYVLLKRHRRIKVFKTDGARVATDIAIPLYDEARLTSGDEKLKNLKAYTILPDGSKFEVKEWYRRKSDWVTELVGTYPSVQDGCILELSYEYRNKRFVFTDPWFFQNQIYTLRSKFVARIYDAFDYRAMRIRIPFDKLEPEVGEFKHGKIFTWELTNLAPYKREPYTRAMWDHITSVSLQLMGEHYRSGLSYGYMRKWWELGERIDSSMYLSIGDSSYMAGFAAKLCEGAIDDRDKARILHAFVRDSIKEVTWEDAYWPDYSDILKKRESERGPKTYLLVLLMRMQNLDADPILICSKDHYFEMHSQSQSTRHFNKILCQVVFDSVAYDLDPNSKITVFPYVEPRDLSDGGLLVDGGLSKISQTAFADRPTGKDVVADMTLAADGSATCNLNFTIKGYDIYDYREFIEGEPDSKKLQSAFLGDLPFGYEVLDKAFEYDPESDKITVIYALKIPQLAEVMDGTYFLPGAIMPIFKNPFISQERQFPIDFWYPRRFRQMVIIQYPDNLVAADLPPGKYETIDGCRFTRRIQRGENAINISSEFEIKNAQFDIGRYQELREFFEKVEGAGDEQFVLTPAEVQNVSGQ